MRISSQLHTYGGKGWRRGPAQDFPFDLILWYIAKTIPTL